MTLVLVGIAGTWAVLVPSKWWEGTTGDPIFRRFVMLLAGFLVGGVAYTADTLLLVHLPYSAAAPVWDLNWGTATHSATGNPHLLGYLAYFGMLFLVLRWWRQADPLRPTRFSVWSVMVCSAWAFLLNLVWTFPEAWGVLWAAMIAISVQLASPTTHWLKSKR